MSKGSYRVWLELGPDLPGDQLCQLLQAIGRLGSINRAGAELELSYRYAWGLIKKAEGRLGRPLLDRRVGGTGGGGAELTAAAGDLLRRYAQFQLEVGGRLDQIFGDQRPTHPAETDAARPILLASTIGPVEAGVVTALEDGFYHDSGILVRHIAAGSGQALQIARAGRAELVLAHAPQLEAEFVAAGFGLGRYPLMYNDFVLLGPAADPAAVAGAASAAEAFRAVAAAGAPFVSRGDMSGTHVKELALWAEARVAPAAPWYRICDRGAMGNAATLRSADRIRAYTLTDRATYLAARTGGLHLVPLPAADPQLRNEFTLIPVNPQRFPQVHHLPARQFVTWALGPRGQQLIRAFGCARYGEPLFFPVHDW